MLRICHPESYPAERRYIFAVLLGEFLGLDYRCEIRPGRTVGITLDSGAAERELVLADVLFQTPAGAWLRPDSLPRRPLGQWDARECGAAAPLVSPQVPVIYGSPLPGGTFCRQSPAQIALGIDIFGSAFFMLTRYEEVVRPDRDDRDRFPARAALAGQEGFLERPIVNEYLEILWWALKTLWPGLERRPRIFRQWLSHDVDVPFCTAGKPALRVLANAVADVWKRKHPGLAARRLRSLIRTARGDAAADMCHTFDWIMDLSERNSLRSAFYFITDHTAGEIDGTYSMSDPAIRRLLRRIHDRGHEIGLHPSYHSFRDPAQIRREYAALLAATVAEQIRQARWGGRQHFLRWEAPTTWQAWADAGLDYDSTVAFADWCGFRAGVCYEYPVFNLCTRESLRLWERPLVVMEGTILDAQYMNLTSEQAWRKISQLRERCRRYSGEFTLLWHNSSLVLPETTALFRRIVEAP